MESLNDLLAHLSLLEKNIDNAEEISIAQCEEHFAHLKKVDEKVDRILGYMDMCKQNAAQYSERAEELENKAKSWEKRLSSLQDYCLYLVKQYPEVEWRGTDRQITKKLNPPSLVCSMRGSFSSSNVIPPEMVEMIPDVYLDKKEIYVLKANEVKDALKAGELLDFATLDRKESLQIKAKLKGDRS